MTKTLFVRLRPRGTKKNSAKFPLRYMIRGIRFEAARGWYQITNMALANDLRNLRLDEMDPDSPPIFDVCTEERAKELQTRERRGLLRRDVEDADRIRAVVAEPTDAVTTRDVAPSKEDTDEEGDSDEEMIDPDPEGLELGEDDQSELEPIGRLPEDVPKVKTRKKPSSKK